MHKYTIKGVSILLCLVMFFAVLPMAASADMTYCTVEEAGLILREHMKHRSKSFTIYVQTEADYTTVPKAVLKAATRPTGDPTEGDYLNWQYDKCNVGLSGKVMGNTYYLTLKYTVTYYSTDAEEAELDTAVAQLLEELQLEGHTDYEKVRSIYDWVTSHVTYDNEHLSDSTYSHQFSAYGAMMDGTAACQGYANLLYRLLLAAGIDNRIIGGEADGDGNGTMDGAHAWNIVRLGGKYYNVDATWDAVLHEAGYKYGYFLKTDEDFNRDHVRWDDYHTDAFYKDYPMAETDSCVMGHSWGDWYASSETEERRDCASCDAYETREAEVAAGPEITAQPDDVSLYVGQTVNFAVSAEGEGLTYQWYIQRANETAFTPWNGKTAPSASFMASAGHNGLQVYCVVTDANGNSVTSETVTLTVKANPFSDVVTGHVFYDAIMWAVDTGITSGTTATTFSPEKDCTRGQVVLFLYRYMGKPGHNVTENPFTDVSATGTATFYDAVMWAYENGITTGGADGTFNLYGTVTRGQFVTFLWRMKGCPEPTVSENPFTDVANSSAFYKAILWAYENGITTGKTETTFAPNEGCTRGQVMTMLHRALNAE